MKIVKGWEEAGVTIEAPFRRTIKVLFAPDRHGVEELTFSLVYLDPNSQTDYHKHDRPELIFIIHGEGVMKVDDREYKIEPDVAYWIETGEMHQMLNTGSETMKFVTVFIPAYTAERNYRRCIEAAKAAAAASN